MEIEKWLEELNLSWLRKDKERAKVPYATCNKTMQLSTAGKSALRDHTK